MVQVLIPKSVVREREMLLDGSKMLNVLKTEGYRDVRYVVEKVVGDFAEVLIEDGWINLKFSAPISADFALDIYKKILIEILTNCKLYSSKVLRLAYIDNFGYKLVVILHPYSDELRRDIEEGRIILPDVDFATLPDRDGNYYSSAYGLDNLSTPVLYSFSNLFIDDLVGVLDANISEKDFKNLESLESTLITLKRMGKDAGEVKRLVGLVEGLMRSERIIRKAVITRAIVSSIGVNNVVIGNVKGECISKVRRLGNGLGIYLNRKVRKISMLEEGDIVSITLADGVLLVRKL